MLVVPPCPEVGPRPSCARAYWRDLWEPCPRALLCLTQGEGVSASFVSHTQLLRARGQGFIPTTPLGSKGYAKYMQRHEIRCNREREGWLSVDLPEGCTVPLPQGGRKKLLGTPCALGHACCVLASKQGQLAFFSSHSAVKLGVKSREKKVCWLRSGQIKLSEFSCQ